MRSVRHQRVTHFISVVCTVLGALGVWSVGTESVAVDGPKASAKADTKSALAITLSTFDYVQTHVLPGAGLSWTLPHAQTTLTLVGGRDALVLARIGTN